MNGKALVREAQDIATISSRPQSHRLDLPRVGVCPADNVQALVQPGAFGGGDVELEDRAVVQLRPCPGRRTA